MVAAPSPGITETNVPTALHRSTRNQWRNVSRTPCHTPPIWLTSTWEMLERCTARSMSSGIA